MSCIAPVEAISGKRLSAGNQARVVEKELLDVLTEAYVTGRVRAPSAMSVCVLSSCR